MVDMVVSERYPSSPASVPVMEALAETEALPLGAMPLGSSRSNTSDERLSLDPGTPGTPGTGRRRSAPGSVLAVMAGPPDCTAAAVVIEGRVAAIETVAGLVKGDPECEPNLVHPGTTALSECSHEPARFHIVRRVPRHAPLSTHQVTFCCPLQHHKSTALPVSTIPSKARHTR